MEEKVLKRINFYIKQAEREFNDNGRKFDESHKMNLAKIHGMLETLSIVTNKSYVITENGVEERG